MSTPPLATDAQFPDVGEGDAAASNTSNYYSEDETTSDTYATSHDGDDDDTSDTSTTGSYTSSTSDDGFDGEPFWEGDEERIPRDRPILWGRNASRAANHSASDDTDMTDHFYLDWDEDSASQSDSRAPVGPSIPRVQRAKDMLDTPACVAALRDALKSPDMIRWLSGADDEDTSGDGDAAVAKRNRTESKPPSFAPDCMTRCNTPSDPMPVDHVVSIHDLVTKLDVNVETGLSSDEAKARLKACGRNILLPPPLLREGVGATSVPKHSKDLLWPNVRDEPQWIRPWDELDASHTMRVFRDGSQVPMTIPAAEVVPGDVVYMSRGDLCMCDVRVLATRGVCRVYQNAHHPGSTMRLARYDMEPETLRPTNGIIDPSDQNRQDRIQRQPRDYEAALKEYVESVGEASTALEDAIGKHWRRRQTVNMIVTEGIVVSGQIIGVVTRTGQHRFNQAFRERRLTYYLYGDRWRWSTSKYITKPLLRSLGESQFHAPCLNALTELHGTEEMIIEICPGDPRDIFEIKEAAKYLASQLPWSVWIYVQPDVPIEIASQFESIQTIYDPEVDENDVLGPGEIGVYRSVRSCGSKKPAHYKESLFVHGIYGPRRRGSAKEGDGDHTVPSDPRDNMPEHSLPWRPSHFIALRDSAAWAKYTAEFLYDAPMNSMMQLAVAIARVGNAKAEYRQAKQCGAPCCVIS